LKRWIKLSRFPDKILRKRNSINRSGFDFGQNRFTTSAEKHLAAQYKNSESDTAANYCAASCRRSEPEQAATSARFGEPLYGFDVERPQLLFAGNGWLAIAPLHLA